VKGDIFMPSMTKSISKDEDGNPKITIEMDGENTGNPMMNQTIVMEATPLESVEAFGIKASSGNIWYGVLAIIVLMVVWKWVNKKFR
jgi:hypothetical protein